MLGADCVMELPGDVLRNAANRAANNPVSVRVVCVGEPPGDRGANVTRRSPLLPLVDEDDVTDRLVSRSPVLPLAAREL